MLDLLLQATPQLPKEDLPATWENYIIWILGLVIAILAGYIARSWDKKGSKAIEQLDENHDEAIGKFDALIDSNEKVNQSLLSLASKLEMIFENDRETKWALQGQKEVLLRIETQMESLTDKTDTNSSSIRSNTAALSKLTKKLKCMEETT